MAHFDTSNPEFKEMLRRLERTDKAEANVFNEMFHVLLNNTIALRDDMKNKFIVSDTEPPDQPIGGIWHDTSGTEEEESNIQSSVIVLNSIVSQTEPEDKTLLWNHEEP